MLTALQREVATIIGRVSDDDEFALAGGAALIERGAIERQTQDLDFFGLDAQSVDRLFPRVLAALQDAGLAVNVIQLNHGFARLSVERDNDRTEVDLAADARLFPLERGPLGKMLASNELAVDKVLAVFGRAEARDFVDLGAVEPRYGLERLCRLATEKDRGFQPAVFAEMVSRFQRLRRDEFELDPAAYEYLQRQVESWRERALRLAETVRLEPRRESGPDLGISR